jgi:dGTPase
MEWSTLLSLKRYGDKEKRLRKKQDESRLGFEVDYDRIIFSDSFRSLQDKTQVVPLSKTDFVHTRLTHSLEVSVVARSLGRIVGAAVLEKYPELVDKGYRVNDFGAIAASAALAHDIGNPPFGHSGEKAIGNYFQHGAGQVYREQLTPKQWQDIIAFEGNANGFRLLTRLQQADSGGLRLSYATLGSFIKYPKESLPVKPTSHIADKKFGVFQSEMDLFTDVVEELGMTYDDGSGDRRCHRHPLAFLVEAADDICYTLIDFEDGINLGLIEEEFALEYLIKLVKDSIDTKKYHGIAHKKDRLSYLRALSVGTLINEAARVFIKNEEAIMKGEFSHSLLDRCAYEAQINDILKISVEKIYQSKEVIEKEVVGYAVIHKLLHVFLTALNRTHDHKATPYDKLMLRLMPEEYRAPGDTLYERILATCTFVASLSDGAALRIYDKLSGTI